MRRKLQTAAECITAIFLALVALFVVLYFLPQVIGGLP